MCDVVSSSGDPSHHGDAEAPRPYVSLASSHPLALLLILFRSPPVGPLRHLSTCAVIRAPFYRTVAAR